jgi:hypothetical protein
MPYFTLYLLCSHDLHISDGLLFSGFRIQFCMNCLYFPCSKGLVSPVSVLSFHYNISFIFLSAPSHRSFLLIFLVHCSQPLPVCYPPCDEDLSFAEVKGGAQLLCCILSALCFYTKATEGNT